MADDPTPLASLSLTHVHYVSISCVFVPFCSILLCDHHHLPNPSSQFTNAQSVYVGPYGPGIVPLRVAGPRPAGALRRIRYPDLVDAGGGDCGALRGAAGVRGYQPCAQASDQGRATPPHERQGVWHAQQPRPVRRLLRRLHGLIPARPPPPAPPRRPPPQPHPDVDAREDAVEPARPGHGRCRRLEQGLPQLPYHSAGVHGIRRRHHQRRRLVRHHEHRAPERLAALGRRLAVGQVAESQGLGRRGRSVSSGLGEVGRQDGGAQSAGQEKRKVEKKEHGVHPDKYLSMHVWSF